MTLSRWILCTLLFCVAPLASASGWQLQEETDQQDLSANLQYAQRTAIHPANQAQVVFYLAFFSGQDYRLRVIDQGTGPAPRYDTLQEAFLDNDCVAGVNGGFFHPDFSPSGLVVTDSGRINHLQRAKLLSGVVYSDRQGTHLSRFAAFKDHPGIVALLQSGPYLVENGKKVSGLSGSSLRYRTFIATDGQDHWVLGSVLSPISLSDLGACLTSAGVLTPWPVASAINLDGGSSTGFFMNRGDNRTPVELEPINRVRTLLGITPREKTDAAATRP